MDMQINHKPLIAVSTLADRPFVVLELSLDRHVAVLLALSSTELVVIATASGGFDVARPYTASADTFTGSSM